MIGLFCLLALALIVFLGVILVGAIYRWCAGRGHCRLADRGDPPWAAGERRREVDPPVLERSLEDEIGRLLEDAGVEDDLHAQEAAVKCLRAFQIDDAQTDVSEAGEDHSSLFPRRCLG